MNRDEEIQKLKDTLKDVMEDYWYILQCYANKNTPFPKEIEGFEDKYKRISKENNIHE